VKKRIRALLPLAWVLGGQAAMGALVGAELRTNPSWDAAASAVLQQDAHVVRLYAVFDGPAGPGDENVVLAVFNTNLTTIDGGVTFYQYPPPNGGNTAPDSTLFGLFPELEWDTFITIGRLDNADGGDSTDMFPDFVMGPNFLLGGWFNSFPPNLQGAPDQDFAVVLAQLTLLDLPPGTDAAVGPDLVLYSSVLTGTLTISHNSPGGPVNTAVLFEEFVDCNGNGTADQLDIAQGTSADVNGNGVPDECDPCTCGDPDLSGMVDLADFAVFANCFTLSAPTTFCPLRDFECCDLNTDGRITLDDFSTFAVIFGTSNTSLPPDCLN
jgi:hypothetical protein